MTKYSQEVINNMVIENTTEIKDLKYVVFGNGERGLAEITRNIEEQILAQNKRMDTEDVRQKAEEERRKKFWDKIIMTILGLLLAGIASFALTMIRLYPVLISMQENLSIISPIK